jgi:hypothetical protein
MISQQKKKKKRLSRPRPPQPLQTGGYSEKNRRKTNPQKKIKIRPRPLRPADKNRGNENPQKKFQAPTSPISNLMRFRKKSKKNESAKKNQNQALIFLTSILMRFRQLRTLVLATTKRKEKLIRMMMLL